ncbi:hypothetical protein [Mycolicibacterium anyangense]|nr:hypothetical protein [Mycolicibacterium anyangense]
MQQALGYAAVAALAGGTIFSSFPLWKSETLSPDSIERRVWWAGCTIAIPLMFLSQLPNWRGGLFVAIMASVTLCGIAFFWTNRIKIHGRIYAAFAINRRADRPPALADDQDAE